jgi:hypothetical protein
MASCYRCGAPNANYRRTTSTGYSKSSWWGSRSYGSGSRTYYGVRSFCQECAESIDRWNTIKRVFLLVAIAIALFMYFNPFSPLSKGNTPSQKAASYQDSGATARIAATKGLNLRDQPNSSATVLLTIPHNDIVGIIDKNGNSESIAGRTANWYKVDYQGTTGWLWSGYIIEN